MHAYLIIAHNEFEVLQSLIAAIDDPRNDIYVHIDNKVKQLPYLECHHSLLHVLTNRNDVRWGDVSMVATELLLFRSAHAIGYDYYHLLSGVDMPLKSQDEIHKFFERNHGKEFIGFSQEDYSKKFDRLVRVFHLFPRRFKDRRPMVRVLRALVVKSQLLLGMRRNRKVEFKKGHQWASVTHEFVDYLLTNESKILKMFRRTWCPDEIYKQTICYNSPFYDKVYCTYDEDRGAMRKIGWQNGELIPYTMSDLETLTTSEMLFARKFTTNNIEVVESLMVALQQEVQEQ